MTGAPAKAGKPVTWAGFGDAVNTFNVGGYDGIGLEFNDNGMVDIDLDKVIADDGSLSDEAVEIIVMLDSYTEYSPSGKAFIFTSRGILM